MADWVHAAEQAYVTAAVGDASAAAASPTGDLLGRARAAAGAIASHYLAVGTPRSFGLIVDGPAAVADATLSLTAHRTWFKPTDVRCAGIGAEQLAAATGGRVVTTDEALACDIVCVHAPIAISAAQLRRGTHVNVLVAVALPDELAHVATIVHETPSLGALAAGLVDGRQLDELTIFVLGDARVALAAV